MYSTGQLFVSQADLCSPSQHVSIGIKFLISEQATNLENNLGLKVAKHLSHVSGQRQSRDFLRPVDKFGHNEFSYLIFEPLAMSDRGSPSLAGYFYPTASAHVLILHHASARISAFRSRHYLYRYGLLKEDQPAITNLV